MEILRDASLQACNTLALPGRAEYLCTANCLEELHEALAYAHQRRLAVTLLGGGSNVVVAADVPGLVLRLALRGVEAEAPTAENTIRVRAAAGENWHQLVSHCLAQGWHGLENLALIPGWVGAAPIQNIGAYGVELASRFVELQAVDLASGETLVLNGADCRFGYRDSIFKGELKGRVAITAVTLALHPRPDVCLDYPELRAALSQVDAPGPRQVYEAVCALRRAKLPDPAQRPNAGSFFKNPVIAADRAAVLRRHYPDLPGYPLPGGVEKIPAAWLIDRAGWKGRRLGPVGVHDRQALVLVHFGAGTGRDLLALASAIAEDVRLRFAIDLELEPVVLGDPATAEESHRHAGSR